MYLLNFVTIAMSIVQQLRVLSKQREFEYSMTKRMQLVYADLRAFGTVVYGNL